MADLENILRQLREQLAAVKVSILVLEGSPAVAGHRRGRAPKRTTAVTAIDRQVRGDGKPAAHKGD
jgi:hypothetical protein